MHRAVRAPSFFRFSLQPHRAPTDRCVTEVRDVSKSRRFFVDLLSPARTHARHTITPPPGYAEEYCSRESRGLGAGAVTRNGGNEILADTAEQSPGLRIFRDFSTRSQHATNVYRAPNFPPHARFPISSNFARLRCRFAYETTQHTHRDPTHSPEN